MEVMGLLLGEFIDDYTVKVVDVFSMPQSGKSTHSPYRAHALPPSLQETLYQSSPSMRSSKLPCLRCSIRQEGATEDPLVLLPICPSPQV